MVIVLHVLLSGLFVYDSIEFRNDNCQDRLIDQNTKRTIGVYNGENVSTFSLQCCCLRKETFQIFRKSIDNNDKSLVDK